MFVYGGEFHNEGQNYEFPIKTIYNNQIKDINNVFVNRYSNQNLRLLFANNKTIYYPFKHNAYVYICKKLNNISGNVGLKLEIYENESFSNLPNYLYKFIIANGYEITMKSWFYDVYPGSVQTGITENNIIGRSRYIVFAIEKPFFYFVSANGINSDYAQCKYDKFKITIPNINFKWEWNWNGSPQYTIEGLINVEDFIDGYYDVEIRGWGY